MPISLCRRANLACRERMNSHCVLGSFWKYGLLWWKHLDEPETMNERSVP